MNQLTFLKKSETFRTAFRTRAQSTLGLFQNPAIKTHCWYEQSHGQVCNHLKAFPGKKQRERMDDIGFFSSLNCDGAVSKLLTPVVKDLNSYLCVSPVAVILFVPQKWSPASLIPSVFAALNFLMTFCFLSFPFLLSSPVFFSPVCHAVSLSGQRTAFHLSWSFLFEPRDRNVIAPHTRASGAWQQTVPKPCCAPPVRRLPPNLPPRPPCLLLVLRSVH